jgi:hypothetical protein
MDEEEKRDGEKEEEDEAATHRHPISTSHDGLPEILPLEMTNTATSTATSPSRTNTTTTHNAATTADPNGLLAAAQQQRIAAEPALHSPAHDVMPAFGQLMGHDVRPGTPLAAQAGRPVIVLLIDNWSWWWWLVVRTRVGHAGVFVAAADAAL